MFELIRSFCYRKIKKNKIRLTECQIRKISTNWSRWIVLVSCKVDWQIRSPLQSASHAQFTENRFATNVAIAIVSIGRISKKGVGDVDWPIVYGQWLCDYIRGHSAYGAECGIGLFFHLARRRRRSVEAIVGHRLNSLGSRWSRWQAHLTQLYNGRPKSFHTLSFLRIIDNVLVSPQSSPERVVGKAQLS